MLGAKEVVFICKHGMQNSSWVMRTELAIGICSFSNLCKEGGIRREMQYALALSVDLLVDQPVKLAVRVARW